MLYILEHHMQVDSHASALCQMVSSHANSLILCSRGALKAMLHTNVTTMESYCYKEYIPILDSLICSVNAHINGNISKPLHLQNA